VLAIKNIPISLSTVINRVRKLQLHLPVDPTASLEKSILVGNHSAMLPVMSFVTVGSILLKQTDSYDKVGAEWKRF
jgi:hypothetical protein